MLFIATDQIKFVSRSEDLRVEAEKHRLRPLRRRRFTSAR
jgi:hypothetical protein